MNLPWWFKITAKIILSLLPFNYSLWRNLNLFRHGAMEDYNYAAKVFRVHYDRVHFKNKEGHYTAMEIGPGDSLLSAFIAKEYGAERSYLIDSGRYAITDIEIYRDAYKRLLWKERSNTKQDYSRMDDTEKMLAYCGSSYLTDGIKSLAEIPDRSVDFIWSQAVLEHISLDEVQGYLSEMRRVLSDNGVISHRIDLRDHLGGGLNNLRFSHKLWESKLFKNAGFYTNRIRFDAWKQLFMDAGFIIKQLNAERWSKLPISIRSMDADFRELPQECLLISGFDVVLEPVLNT